jgi:hypothetical protein
MPDRRHHGKSKHDQRDVAMPAVPGTELVAIETELGLGGLKALVDRPTVAFDLGQSRDDVPAGHQVELPIRCSSNNPAEIATCSG